MKQTANKKNIYEVGGYDSIGIGTFCFLIVAAFILTIFSLILALFLSIL